HRMAGRDDRRIERRAALARGVRPARRLARGRARPPGTDDRAARRALGGRPLATRRGAPRADGLPEPSLRPAVRALATGQSRGGRRRRHVEPRARRRDRRGEGLRIAAPPSPVDLLRTRPGEASRAASRYETSLALVWRRRSDSSCTSLSRILLPS